MSRKIIGVTVGTQLPKPNFKQTDPTKGDYIKNKPDFDGLKSRITGVEEALEGKQPVGDYVLKSELVIDYDELAFDTTEIIFGSNTSPILGQAILGQLVLA